ncbi:MAG: putative CRISPR-associated protein [Candidatus Zipacnadales bacterium]
MNTFILATVGTSLRSNLRRHWALSEDTAIDKRKAHEFLRKQNPQDHLCGAEINSLTHLLGNRHLSSGTIQPPIHLCFLVSDTPESEWTGDVLQHYFKKVRSEVESAEYEIVKGLIGTEPKRFAHEGLRNLVKLAAKKLEEARKKNPSALRIIDATGGYKAQISFAGLMGQVLKVPVTYLFEKFPHSIELPPLPVEFDRRLWIENFELFQDLSEKNVMAVADLPRDLDGSLRDLLDRETIDGIEYVSLSPLLELMHQGFLVTEPREITQPPDSLLELDAKWHVNEAHMSHAPKRSMERARRLCELSWVTRVESVEYVNTGYRWRVQSEGSARLDEIFVLVGDGQKALKFRLKTTARTNPERAWCLEQLKNEA